MLNLENLCWKDGFLWNLQTPQGIFKGNPNWQGLQTIPWPAWNFPPAPNVGFSSKKLKVNSGMSKVETAERSSNKLKSTEITLEVGN